MSSIESVETGTGPDYVQPLTDEELPQEIEASADTEALTDETKHQTPAEVNIEIEHSGNPRDPAMLMLDNDSTKKFGHKLIGKVLYYPERNPDGEWVVGTKTLPPKSKEQ